MSEWPAPAGVHALICPMFESLPVYRTKGIHRKQMKRQFDWDNLETPGKVFMRKMPQKGTRWLKTNRQESHTMSDSAISVVVGGDIISGYYK